MVVLNKIIRKSVSLLARVLVVYVTPTYFFLLCSASQCNKRHHNYEQVFVANQQSESSKRSSSTTEEDASAASQVAVDQVERALKQARDQEDQELIAGLEATLRSQDAIPLEKSIPSIEKTEETDSTTEEDTSEASQVKVSDVSRTLMQEQPEATLRTQKATPLEKSIPSTEEIEETDFTTEEDTSEVSQVKVSAVSRALMREQPEATLRTQKSTSSEESIPATAEIEESGSTTEKDAAVASQVAVDQVERALKQARDQELIAGLEATLRSQDATPLGNLSATEEIEETYSDSQDSSPKVSQAEVSDGGGTLTQEQPEATLRTQKATPLEKSIPSMEETDSDSQDSSPKVLQAEVNDAGRTLMQEEIQKQIEQLTETLITQEESFLERNIPSIKKTDSNPQDRLPKVSQAEVNDVGRTLMQEEIEQLKSALLRTPEVVPPLENIITTSLHDDDETLSLLTTSSLLGEASARTSHLSAEGNDKPKDLINNMKKWKKRECASKNLHQGDEKSINNVIRLLSDGEKID